MIARRSMLAVALVPLFGCAHAEPTPQTAIAPDFLDSLIADSTAPPSDVEIAALAQDLGIEERTIRAVIEVEGRSGGGFDANGKPAILFEPHIFSRRTNRQFDASHPNLSYPSWDSSRYPRTLEDRWTQLRDAYALDADAALQSTSWGLFQQMGFHFAASGYPDAHAFVRDLSRSNGAQLRAWSNWLRSQGLIDELQARDWSGFTRAYNGPGQIERYSTLLSETYARLGAN